MIIEENQRHFLKEIEPYLIDTRPNVYMRKLKDGRVIHLYFQIYNFKVTLSENENSVYWDDGY